MRALEGILREVVERVAQRERQQAARGHRPVPRRRAGWWLCLRDGTIILLLLAGGIALAIYSRRFTGLETTETPRDSVTSPFSVACATHDPNAGITRRVEITLSAEPLPRWHAVKLGGETVPLVLGDGKAYRLRLANDRMDGTLEDAFGTPKSSAPQSPATVLPAAALASAHGIPILPAVETHLYFRWLPRSPRATVTLYFEELNIPQKEYSEFLDRINVPPSTISLPVP